MKEEVQHSLIWGVSVTVIVGMLIFGISSCSEREDRLRVSCIEAGGTVIVAGPSTNCIMSHPGKVQLP